MYRSIVSCENTPRELVGEGFGRLPDVVLGCRVEDLGHR